MCPRRLGEADRNRRRLHEQLRCGTPPYKAAATGVSVSAVAATASAEVPTSGAATEVDINLTYTVGPSASAAALTPVAALSIDAPVAAATGAAV